MEPVSQGVVDADNKHIRARRKDDLFAFESTTVPRPDDVCERYVRTVDPLWGFVIYGFLYFFVAFVCFAIGSIPGFLLGAAIATKGGVLANVLGWTGGVAAFAVAWLGFARWVRSKRARALPLIRDGVLLDGAVISTFDGGRVDVAKRLAMDFAGSRAGVKFYRVEIKVANASRVIDVPITGHARPVPGTVTRVLFHASSTHALVFDAQGRAMVATVR